MYEVDTHTAKNRAWSRAADEGRIVRGRICATLRASVEMTVL